MSPMGTEREVAREISSHCKDAEIFHIYVSFAASSTKSATACQPARSCASLLAT